MYAVPSPHAEAWPPAADFLTGFAAIYDWDTVVLQPAAINAVR